MQDITYVRNNLPGYGLANARAGLGSDRFSAYLFCDNLTNKLAILTNNVAQTVNIPVGQPLGDDSAAYHRHRRASFATEELFGTRTLPVAC